jgi:3-oxoacyl-[acyl-carrier protein] reductase
MTDMINYRKRCSLEQTHANGWLAEEDHDTIKSSIPAGRFASPEEVAEAVAFLVENEYANGSILNLDGGLSSTSIVRGKGK